MNWAKSSILFLHRIRQQTLSVYTKHYIDISADVCFTLSLSTFVIVIYFQLHTVSSLFKIYYKSGQKMTFYGRLPRVLNSEKKAKRFKIFCV